jgi:hypothetical protein
MSHRDSVTAAPTGAVVTASSPSTPIAAFEDRERRLYGVQFHPEVGAHAERARRSSRTSSYEIAATPPTWTPAAVIEEQVGAHPRRRRLAARPLRALGRRRLRGRGAARCHKAVGDQLTLRLRRPRALRETRRSRSSRPSAVTSTSRSSTSRRRSVPHAARRRLRPGAEAEDRRRGVHPGLRGGGRKLGDVRFLVQGRSTRTSSSRAGATRLR